MSVCLCIVTHARDAAYCALCVRSISKFVRGFARIMLFVPDRDLPVFAPLRAATAADGRPIELTGYFDVRERSHLHHEFIKATVDLYCPECDWFCYTDADVIFTRATTPADYFRDDRAILLVAPYAKFPDVRGGCWRASVAHSLGIEPLYETMQWCQLCHHACTLEDMRLHIERLHQRPFWQHVIEHRMQPDGVTAMNFAEFSTMGSFAIEVADLRQFYHVVEVGTPEAEAVPRFQRQGWTHHWSSPVVHAQELADFGRIIG